MVILFSGLGKCFMDGSLLCNRNYGCISEFFVILMPKHQAFFHIKLRFGFTLVSIKLDATLP